MTRFDVLFRGVLPAWGMARRGRNRAASGLALLVSLGGSLWAPELGAKKPRGTLLVLGLEAEGFAAADVEALDAAIRAEAGDVSGLQLLPRPALDTAALALSAGCESRGGACLAAIGRSLGVSAVLEPSMAGDASAATLSLLLVRVANGREQSLTRTLVDVAGESAAEVRVYVANLFGKKRELPPGALVLVPARGGPSLSEAVLRLDDRAIKADELRRIPAGAHRLEVEKPGHQSFVWQGQVHPGRETKVQVALTPEVVAATPPPTRPEVAPPPSLPPPAPRAARRPPEAQVAQAADEGGGVRVFTLITSAAAVAAGVVGTIYGVQKLSLDSEIRQAQDVRNEACRNGDVGSCNRSVCDDTLSADCQSADTKATVATVAFVMAGVFAVGAITAFFLEAPDEPAFAGSLVPREGGADAVLRLRF